MTYIPPTLPDDEDSVFAHYASGINFDKYDNITVDVKGNNPPPAITVTRLSEFSIILEPRIFKSAKTLSHPSQTFEETTLCESLRNAISKSGYVKPTPVQKHGMPIVSAGRDLMACAQTGSGKTVRAGSPPLNPSPSDPDEPLAFAGRLPAPHPAAADGRRRCRQFLQRVAGARSPHRRANKGAYQSDLPGGQEVLVWVRSPVEPSLFLLRLHDAQQNIHHNISVTRHKIRCKPYQTT